MTSPQGSVSEDTARGIFISAAVGDALGWPQEFRGGLVGGKKARQATEPTMSFRDWSRNGGYRAHRYRDPVRAGEYSDDTQLLMSVARSCLTGEAWLSHLTNTELPTWPLYQRGGGGAVLRATSAWADGHPPWETGTTQRAAATVQRYRGAGANGVAMRIAPHVCWADTAEDLTTRIMFDGLTTHGHPRALVGALTFGSALRHAATANHTLEFGELVDAASQGLVDSDTIIPMLPDMGVALDGYAELWNKTNAEMSRLLDIAATSLRRGAVSAPNTTLADLGCTDTKVNGAGTITAAGAIYLAARFGSRPDAAMLTAAYLPDGDTDTLASMAGAILGAIHGTDWIPQHTLESLQDREYLAALSVRNASRDTTSHVAPHVKVADYRKAAGDFIEHGRANALHDFPDGRKADLISVDRLSGTAHRLALRLDDGQTVFVDVLGRATTSSTRSPRTEEEQGAGGVSASGEPEQQSRRDSTTQDSGDAGEANGESTHRRRDDHPSEANGPSRLADPTGSDNAAEQRGGNSTTSAHPQAAREQTDSGNATAEQGKSTSAAVPSAHHGPDTNRVTAVTLPSWNLSRCASFYAQLLDRDLTVRGRTVRISPSLHLAEAESGSVGPEISIVVGDVRAAARRLRVALDDGVKTLVVQDPDGRTVRVSE